MTKNGTGAIKILNRPPDKMLSGGKSRMPRLERPPLLVTGTAMEVPVAADQAKFLTLPLATQTPCSGPQSRIPSAQLSTEPQQCRPPWVEQPGTALAAASAGESRRKATSAAKHKVLLWS